MVKPHIRKAALIEYLSKESLATEKIHEAIAQAELSHRYQLRDDGQPYLEQHIYPVALAVLTDYSGRDKEKAIIVALLHDCLEEITYVDIDNLRERFGSTVVHALQMLRKEHLFGEERTQEIKHLEHRDFCKRLMKASRLLRLVKVLDRINNVICTEVYRNFEKYERFIRDTLDYYLPLAASVDKKYASLMQSELARVQKDLDIHKGTVSK
jgi:(p)ppGpp synthase/HD superfamily hydrolase